MTEPRLKIAVFIDFDNIEIGVKTTLGQPFDIAAILEGIKERGEVVTKVAYGDWKRAGDHGRLLSQHAIRMVQRNLTPGGDKNGADINLALDALEMAFTHDHINAFVIVGGDSDFITLVEKLKQYDKKVFVVGGRQFTSLVMQKNCHEFIAYENLVGSRRPAAAERKGAAASSGVTDVAKALPLVKRALKVLVDREVSPQLGLLKSTLLQLDSTFSERDYGASTFRDFIEKVAQTGIVTLRHAGRSLLVDLAETNGAGEGEASGIAPAPDVQPAPQPRPARRAEDAQVPAAAEPRTAESSTDAAPGVAAASKDTGPLSADPVQAHAAVLRTQEIFQRAAQPPRWPMYVRQVKQYLRAADDGFDERKWGFGTIVEFLRACQREGVLRLERDRQGVLRVFAGPNLQRPVPTDAAAAEASADMADLEADAITEAVAVDLPGGDVPEAGPVVDPEPVPAAPEPVLASEAAVEAEVVADAAPVEPDEAPPAPASRRRRPRAAKTAAAADEQGVPKPARKSASRKSAASRTPRVRKKSAAT